MAPIVDLWITLVQVFKSKIFLFIVTGIGFLYTWTFWTFSMLAFSEETSFTFLDYFWSNIPQKKLLPLVTFVAGSLAE